MKVQSHQETWLLKDGNEIPVLGFGLYLVEPGSDSQQSIRWALEAGYRHFDTASFYGNEHDLGLVIKESGIPRNKIFITTKLWNKDHGYKEAQRAFDLSLEKLGLDYVDLYLIHWPVTHKRSESWRALIELKKQGRAKSIGVSNYTVRHLKELKQEFSEMPVVNQVEFHPFLYQKELHEFCIANEIQLEAYSPLTRGKKLNDSTIREMANKYNKTPAQILLRWCIEHNIVPLVKSSTQQRIIENSLIFDFEIKSDDLIILDGLNQDFRVAWDPTFEP
jgi:diketogulonate reductase-like aldo/keto reductase